LRKIGRRLYGDKSPKEGKTFLFALSFVLFFFLLFYFLGSALRITLFSFFAIYHLSRYRFSSPRSLVGEAKNIEA
jgi:hypothetical protein